MTWQAWMFLGLLVLQFAWTVYVAYQRDRYRELAKILAVELPTLKKDPRLHVGLPLGGKPLTRPATKAQDAPKRLTGAQLRRVSDRVNVEATAALQERPNSEILQEQEHG